MSLNKENIKSDLKKAFEFVYVIVRVVLHLGLLGTGFFYAIHIDENLTLKDVPLLGQFMILEILGFTTLTILTFLFHFFHYIETRYFKGSYRMAYILLKYIFPHSRINLSGIDYEDVCIGYDEVVKRGNAYFSIEQNNENKEEN